MTSAKIIFYLLCLVIISGALLAVTSRKIFRAAVYLLFSLIGIAGLYFYMNYEFLGAVQIVVYVGGIVVLMIFSIFLTHDSGSNMSLSSVARRLFSAFAVLFSGALTLVLISRHIFNHSTNPAIEASVKNIGRQMLSTTEHGYILPFEVVSILLLAAMIGCIVIAIRIKPKV